MLGQVEGPGAGTEMADPSSELMPPSPPMASLLPLASSPPLEDDVSSPLPDDDVFTSSPPELEGTPELEPDLDPPLDELVSKPVLGGPALLPHPQNAPMEAMATIASMRSSHERDLSNNFMRLSIREYRSQ